jgi:hypothetical protein
MPIIRRLRINVPAPSNRAEREQVLNLQLAGAAANGLLAGVRALKMLPRPAVVESRTVRDR